MMQNLLKSGHIGLYCILTLVFSVQESNSQTAASVVRTFVDAINSHDIDAIANVMTSDHLFADAHGNRLVGKEKMRAAWNLYFSWFPDYTIELQSVIVQNDTVAVFGFAQGTFQRTSSSDNNNHWRLPAAWKAVVSRGKMSEWHVFADTKVPFDIMQRFMQTSVQSMERATGIGGVFFKSKDPTALVKWYDEHLGTKFGDAQHYSFRWRELNDRDSVGRTVLGIFGEETKYFLPSEKPFMLNFRVKNLEALLAKLRKENVRVEEKVESYEYGKFGWILDPEGNKIELWEPIDGPLENVEPTK
ncbi:MAG: nuclear transport factor 2 family protein [Bacteroidetes bacterium]|nr:nuclear transport factor 2 family protein [Bacteroidota bacterium]MCW5897044.1 nuclear transport factor 2 family protein [Bacteroidota bacterium]